MKESVRREVGEGRVTAAEVAVEVQRLVRGGGSAVHRKEIADLTDVTLVARAVLRLGGEGREEEDRSAIIRVGEHSADRAQQREGIAVDEEVVRIRRAGQSIVQVTAHDPERRPGFTVTVHTVFIHPPELCGAVHHVQEEDKKHRHDRHRDHQLQQGEGRGWGDF